MDMGKGTPMGPNDSVARENTDTHLWPIVSQDLLADSLHITAGGALGINCGGHVIVREIRDWHELASRELPKPEPR